MSVARTSNHELLCFVHEQYFYSIKKRRKIREAVSNGAIRKKYFL